MKKLKLITLYLVGHRKAIGIFLIFSLVFALVFFLYNLPMEPVVYAVTLCGGISIVFSTMDYWQYHKRHKTLADMLNGITLSIDKLPIPKDLIERDYQDLIEVIHRDKMQIVSEGDSSKRDLIDYYTLWVHQIKTPISTISLLLQSEDSPQNEQMSIELFKIEQYVEMVLQYLRLDSESTDFALKYYDLDSIVKQAIRKYAKLFILKNISLDLSKIQCKVLTDEKWLVFSIEQILSNGLKYTKRGKISIYMEDEKTLVIEDTGIGIQREDLPRVFEKGFTGYNGRTDKKSTGIGLYLCKRIISKLGHTITIDSEVDKGTKVKIQLDSVELWAE